MHLRYQWPVLHRTWPTELLRSPRPPRQHLPRRSPRQKALGGPWRCPRRRWAPWWGRRGSACLRGDAKGSAWRDGPHACRRPQIEELCRGGKTCREYKNSLINHTNFGGRNRFRLALRLKGGNNLHCEVSWHWPTSKYPIYPIQSPSLLLFALSLRATHCHPAEAAHAYGTSQVSTLGLCQGLPTDHYVDPTAGAQTRSLQLGLLNLARFHQVRWLGISQIFAKRSTGSAGTGRFFFKFHIDSSKLLFFTLVPFLSQDLLKKLP